MVFAEVGALCDFIQGRLGFETGFHKPDGPRYSLIIF
jgi:hypothetical protein